MLHMLKELSWTQFFTYNMLWSSSLLGGRDQETWRRDTDPTEPSETSGRGSGVPSVGSSSEWEFQAQISDQHT